MNTKIRYLNAQRRFGMAPYGRPDRLMGNEAAGATASLRRARSSEGVQSPNTAAAISSDVPIRSIGSLIPAIIGAATKPGHTGLYSKDGDRII